MDCSGINPYRRMLICIIFFNHAVVTDSFTILFRGSYVDLLHYLISLTFSNCRQASQTCLEGESPQWTTLAFPFCDAHRVRSGSKSQFLGKHKSISDPSRPPRSKVPRTMDSQEESGLSSKPPMPSTRPVMEFNHLVHSVSHENEDISGLPLVEDIHLLDSIPHEYDPELLRDLEDLDLQLDIIDIG